MRPIHTAKLDMTRPVLVLTRELVRPRWGRVTVAPITSTIRGLSTEVPVGPANGLEHSSVVSCDDIVTVPSPRSPASCATCFRTRTGTHSSHFSRLRSRLILTTVRRNRRTERLHAQAASIENGWTPTAFQRQSRPSHRELFSTSSGCDARALNTPTPWLYRA